MIRFKGGYLSILKTFHLLFIAFFFGGITASLVILLSKVSAEENFSSIDTDIVLYRLNRYLVYFSFFGLTITALLYGLFTNWGILKHRWIIIKWLMLIVIAGIYIVVYKPSISGIVSLSDGGFDTGEAGTLYGELVRKSRLNNVLLLSLLVIVFFISTLKPFGRRSSDFLAENRIARISLISFILLFAGFSVLGWINLHRLRTMPISSPDLSTVRDGIYKGEFSDGGGIYNVDVEINNHKISNINLETDRDSRYVDYARPVTGRIIEEQTLLVDAVTGATTTSKCIIKAVEEALKKAYSSIPVN